MSERKIVIPDGMRNACGLASKGVDPELLSYPLYSVVEAALKWLSDNPIIPDSNQIEKLERAFDGASRVSRRSAIIESVREFQRIAFVATEVPPGIWDLMWGSNPFQNIGAQARHDRAVMEAYRRGKAEARNA